MQCRHVTGRCWRQPVKLGDTGDGVVSSRLVRGWAYLGLATWILENASLRVTVVPELGGKILELVDKIADRDLLWHSPRTPPRRAPFGAWFDDWWCGGWDEIFPTGDTARLHNERLPYMGELWSVPWTAVEEDAGHEARAITTVGLGTIAPARLERRLELRGDDPVLRVQYRLTNLDRRPLPFVWGIHPGLAVSDKHRIDLPASDMLVGLASDVSLGGRGEAYTWPFLPDPSSPDGRRDMRLVRGADALVFGGHWATKLRDGWLALTDTATGRGLAITFPLDVFPVAWLWLVYGGWRGYYHVALEPWTGHPMQLEDAMAAGTARTLGPGEELTADVAFIVYGGQTSVQSVAQTGEAFVVR